MPLVNVNFFVSLLSEVHNKVSMRLIMLTIGKLATRANVSPDTLRYYEKEGLLSPFGKSAAGYRLYDENAVRRLQFIRQAQQCGFSLAEIRELLAIKKRDNACCYDVRSVAIEKKSQLERKITALASMSRTLGELIAVCDDNTRSLDECPILNAFETAMQNLSRH